LNEDAGERAERYMANVEKAIANLEWVNLPITVAMNDLVPILDTVKRYVSDARYFLHEGKSTTALASISYAEGLLDAIKLLRVAKFSWQVRDL
jgi:FAD synthetase